MYIAMHNLQGFGHGMKCEDDDFSDSNHSSPQKIFNRMEYHIFGRDRASVEE
jgi:hypothetical protein